MVRGSIREPRLMEDIRQERRIQYTIRTSSETVDEGRLLSYEVKQLHRWAEGGREDSGKFS